LEGVERAVFAVNRRSNQFLKSSPNAIPAGMLAAPRNTPTRIMMGFQ